MSGFIAILKRELLALFVTPLAWVAISLFLFVQGIHFFFLVDHYANQQQLTADQGPVQAFFGGTIFLYLPLLFICPLLTMRLFAEERRSGTIEALLTAPVGSAGVVLAKYTAALVAYVAMWAPTGLYMVFIDQTGDLDTRVLGASYLAIFLVGAGYLAIGTMTSAFSKSQVVAAISSGVMSVALTMCWILAKVVDRPFTDVITGLAWYGHFDPFAHGLVHLKHVVYFGLVTFVALFAATRVLEARRWR